MRMLSVIALVLCMGLMAACTQDLPTSNVSETAHTSDVLVAAKTSEHAAGVFRGEAYLNLWFAGC